MSPARSSRRTSPHGPTGGGTGWASAKPLGGLSVAEVARRMGMRPPSLYKYFPSRTAMYDALFARGAREQQAAIGEAVTGRGPGLETLSEGFRATVRWCVEHPVLAQLLYWRPVPGFEPSSAAFAPSAEAMDELRGVLADAVAGGELAPDAASDEAVRLLTVLMSGLISQQLANEPGADFASGRFSSLVDRALDLFVDHFEPEGTQPWSS